MQNFDRGLLAKRILFSFFLIFEMSALRLCAEDVSPAKAQVMRDSFVAEAKKYVGSPYVYGAVGPDSFDCSGLIYFVARESLQIQLPRTAKAIYNYCKVIPDKDREVGDLLFFKTTSQDVISHVGIYIGNNQFISAISDGPNSGVVVSSLKQEYWKPKYVCTGKFLKSGISEDVIEEEKKSENYAVESSVAENVIFAISASGGWSFIAPSELMFRFRGVDIQTDVRYAKWPLQPGLALNFRFNTGNKLFQIPLLFTATINDYFKIYAGPVISFGHGCLPGNGKGIKASFFPGIVGCTFATPAIKAWSTKIQLIQDISYSVFNNLDNSALGFVESIGAGLVMYTGIRVSFPLNNFMGGK